jgi:hypothetical protein
MEQFFWLLVGHPNSGAIYGNDQISCGGVQSTQWLVTGGVVLPAATLGAEWPVYHFVYHDDREFR